MHRYCTFLFFISIYISALSQDSVVHAFNTIYQQDTIIRTRSVEKVVFVNEMPQNYTGIDFSFGRSFSRYDNVPQFTQKGKSYNLSLAYQLYYSNFIFEAGIGYAFKHKEMHYTFPALRGIQDTYILNDTLFDSYYIIEYKDGSEEKVYPVDKIQRDTIRYEEYDATKKYSNTYRLIEIPFAIGYQIKYGFYSLDLKTGIAPTFLRSYYLSNTCISNENTIALENGKTSKFFYTLRLQAGIKYMLTYRVLLHTDFAYSMLLWEQKHPNVKSLHTYTFTVSCGVSFLLKDF